MGFHGKKMNDFFNIPCSLTLKNNYDVCSILESKYIDALSLDEFQRSLLVYEQKMNHSLTFMEQALQSFSFVFFNSRRSVRGRGREIWDRDNRDRGNKDGGRNFIVNNDYSKGRGKYFDKFNIECYCCHNFGHHYYKCHTR